MDAIPDEITVIRAALNISWMDRVPNMELYGDIPKVN